MDPTGELLEKAEVQGFVTMADILDAVPEAEETLAIFARIAEAADG